jgi:hypothetical protein
MRKNKITEEIDLYFTKITKTINTHKYTDDEAAMMMMT